MAKCRFYQGLAALNADPKVGLETLRVKTQCYF
jgi:hypothetical protein